MAARPARQQQWCRCHIRIPYSSSSVSVPKPSSPPSRDHSQDNPPSSPPPSSRRLPGIRGYYCMVRSASPSVHGPCMVLAWSVHGPGRSCASPAGGRAERRGSSRCAACMARCWRSGPCADTAAGMHGTNACTPRPASAGVVGSRPSGPAPRTNAAHQHHRRRRRRRRCCCCCCCCCQCLATCGISLNLFSSSSRHSTGRRKCP